MAIRPPIINVMTKVVYKVARDLVRDFGELENLQVSNKGVANFVTSADIRTEENLKKNLKFSHPSFGFITEESEKEIGEDPDTFWVIDPIDGTTNFIHAIPHFAISIALMSKGVITAGIVYDPIKDELFWAAKGEGAYVNDHRLRVSARKYINEAVVATSIPYVGNGDSKRFTQQSMTLMPVVAGLRSMGSPSLDLAYVAAGRYEGCWHTGLKIWQMAAANLLIAESGGYVTEMNGAGNMLESGEVLAANDHIHPTLSKLLRAVAK